MKTIFILLLFIIASSINAQTITFDNNTYTFGSSASEFLTQNKKFSIVKEESSGNISVYLKKIEGTNGYYNYFVNYKVYFHNDKLFNFSVTEYAAPERIRENILNFVKSFDLISHEEDEMGIITEKYQIDNIMVEFGGFEGYSFNCFEKDLYYKAKSEYPERFD